MPEHITPTIRASSTSFAQLKADGLVGIIARLIATNPAIANPAAAPTVNPTGGGVGGGSLAAGTYLFLYTDHTGYGETLPSSATAGVVVSAGNIPRVTFPALPAGVASRSLYITTDGGAAGTARLYAAGITATTYDCTAAAFVNPSQAVPTANTTALSNLAEYLNAHAIREDAGNFLRRAAEILSNYVQGDPMSVEQTVRRLQSLAGVAKAFSTAIDESIELVFDNQGTIVHSPNQGGGRTRRTF